MIEQIKEASPIERVKKRITKLQELETKLMNASAVRADSIFIRQNAIYENYYADVSDLLDELEKAQKEVEAVRSGNRVIHGNKEYYRRLCKQLSEEHTAMKEALEWIVECGTDYQSINKAQNALTTISDCSKGEHNIENK